MTGQLTLKKYLAVSSEPIGPTINIHINVAIINPGYILKILLFKKIYVFGFKYQLCTIRYPLNVKNPSTAY